MPLLVILSLLGFALSVPCSADKWAVIVGINSYVDEGIPDLRYGVQDAQLMYEALTGAEGGFPATNVILMTDEQEDRLLRPGRSAIIRSLSQGLSKAAPQDLVLVYFAGHAVESEGSTSLLISDTMLSAMALTGLPLEMVKVLMEKCGAKTRVLVVDSCHSGAANALGAMESAAAQSLFEGAEGFLVLSSCDQHEQSFEWAEKGHGAFTWFLAEGLRGRADADGDQLVTTGELASYARDATRRWAAGRGLVQTPRSVSSLPHEVVMARVEGRLPPPGVDPWETEGRLGQEITGPDGGQYVWVPPGEFEMGSKDAVDTTPHPVWISRGFWLSKCEVTCAQYYEFCCGTRRSFPFQGSSGPNHPVVMVSWLDAQAYCEHYDMLLPSEAEWEYAARGQEESVYPWGNEWDPKMCCNPGNPGPGARMYPVGSFPTGASWCGALDLAGNVWEWCRDRYDAGYYRHSPLIDPDGPPGGEYRVARGGSWHPATGDCRSAIRHGGLPATRNIAGGFRPMIPPK